MCEAQYRLAAARRVALGPGSRARTTIVRKIGAEARAWPGHERRWRAILNHHPSAQPPSFPRRVFAPGFCLCLFHPPPRGASGAPQGAVFLLSRVSARDVPCLARRGARPAGRARLSALHRGDFRSGAALPSPAFPPDQCSELLAARSLCLAGGVPDLPGPSGTSRRRRTPPPPPPSAPLRATAPPV